VTVFLIFINCRHNNVLGALYQIFKVFDPTNKILGIDIFIIFYTASSNVHRFIKYV